MLMPALAAARCCVNRDIGRLGLRRALRRWRRRGIFLRRGHGHRREAVFRGVLMTAVERRWNKTAAVLGPPWRLPCCTSWGGS
ncbi:MAG: hypothetical protein ACLRZH_13995 [Ruthenibacterium lactatiformans]